MTCLPTDASGAGAGPAGSADAAEVEGQSRGACPLIRAAKRLGIARDSAYRQAAAGTLPVPAFKSGSRWYVSEAKLAALLGDD